MRHWPFFTLCPHSLLRMLEWEQGSQTCPGALCWLQNHGRAWSSHPWGL